MTSTLWFQLSILPLGALIALAIGKIFNRPRLNLRQGGYTYEAGHHVMYLTLDVQNRPIAHRFMKLTGNKAQNLSAVLIFTEEISIQLPGVDTQHSKNTAVTTVGLQWIDSDKMIKDTFLSTIDIQSNAYTSLRIFTKIDPGEGYRVGSSNYVISDKNKKFTLNIRGDGNVFSQWNIEVLDKGSRIEDLSLHISKKILSAKITMRIQRLKRAVKKLLIG